MANIVNLLKLHILLFYASFACHSIFITVYYKTYTEASYDEIGTLFMTAAFVGAFLRPSVCSFADRHGTYKQCLIAGVGMFCLANIALAILPFCSSLITSANLHPKFIWYLVAFCSLVSSCSFGIIITFDDVFVIHRCRNSTTGEHFGQYRYFGSVGWAFGALGLALVEKYIDLPYMVLPMASACILALADFLLITQMKNITHSEKTSIISLEDIGDRHAATNTKPASTNNTISSTTSADKAPITTATIITCHPPVDTSVSQHELNNSATDKPAIDTLSNDDAEKQEISIALQLTLLYRLNKYDNYNMVKYLLMFVILGAIIQVHYAFYVQFMTEVLDMRRIITLLFAFTAVVQIIICVGETCGLLWIARLMIRSIGRDASLMMCVVISGVRYAISGFLIDQLNVWMLAILEIQTGFLWGVTYTLMIETGSCYLAMLNKLLVMEPKGSNCGEEEIKFIAHLEELKKVYSIESIRFALEATIQSNFSGAFEGFGFALGPLAAGLWLSSNGNSLAGLYQDLGILHLVIIIIIVVLEFGLIRCIIGVRSKADRLRYY